MSERKQFLNGETADGIYWWIHATEGHDFWAVIPTNPLRIEVCNRYQGVVYISTANIGDWIVEDDAGYFHVESNDGATIEPTVFKTAQESAIKSALSTQLATILAGVEKEKERQLRIHKDRAALSDSHYRVLEKAFDGLSALIRKAGEA